jgi:hypothetical protein
VALRRRDEFTARRVRVHLSSPGFHVKQVYPLNWPPSWRRTLAGQRTHARFNSKSEGGTNDVTIHGALERIEYEMGMMKILLADVVVTTNNALRRDGAQYSRPPPLTDPGVAVYWKHKGKHERCMAIDRYDTIAGNLAAVAASLSALRAVERHGGAEIMDRAFTGFAALAAPEQWFQILGVSANASKEEIDKAFRRLASAHHPDKSDENDSVMGRINRARDQAMEQFE